MWCFLHKICCSLNVYVWFLSALHCPWCDAFPPSYKKMYSYIHRSTVRRIPPVLTENSSHHFGTSDASTTATGSRRSWQVPPILDTETSLCRRQRTAYIFTNIAMHDKIGLLCTWPNLVSLPAACMELAKIDVIGRDWSCVWVQSAMYVRTPWPMQMQCAS